MPEQDGLMRVFWPADLPRSDHRGVVVGWRNSALDVFVLAILEEVDVGMLLRCDSSGGLLTLR
jgi:phosphatidylinositol glycan class Q protein